MLPSSTSHDASASGEDALARAAQWIHDGHRVALATVVDTWGSSPRPAGSRMVIRDDRLFVGSVSGGCVEGAVVEEAEAVIRDGEARTLQFGITDDEAWEVGLACGGQVTIFVEVVR